TAPSVYVERETPLSKTVLAGEGLLSHKFSDLIPSFNIGYRITSRRFSDGILVNHFDLCNPPQVPMKLSKGHRTTGSLSLQSLKCRVKGLADQTGFPTDAYAVYNRELPKRQG